MGWPRPCTNSLLINKPVLNVAFCACPLNESVTDFGLVAGMLESDDVEKGADLTGVMYKRVKMERSRLGV